MSLIMQKNAKVNTAKELLLGLLTLGGLIWDCHPVFACSSRESCQLSSQQQQVCSSSQKQIIPEVDGTRYHILLDKISKANPIAFQEVLSLGKQVKQKLGEWSFFVGRCFYATAGNRPYAAALSVGLSRLAGPLMPEMAVLIWPGSEEHFDFESDEALLKDFRIYAKSTSVLRASPLESRFFFQGGYSDYKLLSDANYLYLIGNKKLNQCQYQELSHVLCYFWPKELN